MEENSTLPTDSKKETFSAVSEKKHSKEFRVKGDKNKKNRSQKY